MCGPGGPKSPPNDTKFFQGHIFMICTHYKKKVSETQKLPKNANLANGVIFVGVWIKQFFD